MCLAFKTYVPSSGSPPKIYIEFSSSAEQLHLGTLITSKYLKKKIILKYSLKLEINAKFYFLPEDLLDF